MAESNINIHPNQAVGGLNLNNSVLRTPPGQLSYALNAVVENVDGQGISYQNESGNTFCTTPPEGYQVVGKKAIIERELTVLWLANSKTGGSEIGVVEGCNYRKLINDPCIGLDINFPIHKAFYRIIDCGTEVYWTDGRERRYINIDKLPFREIPDQNGCGFITTDEVDCNKLSVQPNFSIPQIDLVAVESEGELKAGTYQFAVQYSNDKGEGYTSYYSITNPLPIHDPNKVTLDHDYPVNKSVHLSITGIDQTSIYDYINIAVIKTVNLISSFELIGTYKIEKESLSIVYTGQKIANLTENDIFERFPVYTSAKDIYTTQGVLGWADLTTQERISYQEIASHIELMWQTWRLPADAYKNPMHAAEHRGYMRDEIIPFEIVFLLKNGWQTDKFPLTGRLPEAYDLEIISNDDVPQEDKCETEQQGLPRWKIYNTAQITDYAPEFTDDPCYEGPYQYGKMAYWESAETYPCDESWGPLAGRPIRHPKMPDCITSPHYSMGGEYIFPLGLRIDVQQVIDAINNSSLPDAQKEQIQGFKIVRGNRAGGQKSVVAKGILSNVLRYTTKNNLIDIENILGNQEDDTQTIAQRLLSTARSLVSKAKNETTLLLSAIDPTLTQADNALAIAYDQIPGSTVFNASMDTAIERLESAYQYLSTRDSNQAIIATSYVEAALQVCQSIRDSGEAFLALQGLEQTDNSDTLLFPNYGFNDVKGSDPFLENILDNEKTRYTFQSPDTSFYQPTLGSTLKLELATYGLASSHMVEVEKHARYQFINAIAYVTSLAVGVGIGFASGMYGVSTKPFDGVAAFTAYQTLLDIIRKVTPRKNPCYQVNAVGNYPFYKPVANNGNKQRNLDISYYLNPGRWSGVDEFTINNHQRESSVYLKTAKELPFPHEIDGVFQDVSKLIPSDNQLTPLPISAYYAAIKRNIPNQWGQIHSYETVDTGFQWIGDISQTGLPTATIFGGDTFINRFAYKKKLPFFLDHRVAVADESDISFNELSNVGRVKYWFSTDANAGSSAFGALFGIRPTRFYQRRVRTFYDEGKIFLFHYSIPYFFCESEVNVDMRNAFNGQEGDFYPHVGTGIPDTWLQEINTTIQQDNSYHYNKTLSKQNKETHFTYLPQDWDNSCDTVLPFEGIYSEKNDWLVYRPISKFKFPQIHGKLTSIDGLDNNAVLVRFENHSKVYNTLLTINTSSPQAAYLGNDTLFKSSPPLEFKQTDTGFVGSQHKCFIRTPYGDVITDASRGQVFLLEGTRPREISTPEVGRFFQQYLDVDQDNHFNGKGIHGVYDPANKRVLITKKDGAKSFTLSFNFLTNSWISFHSYLPDYYIEHTGTFYSGNSTGIWRHDSPLFNHFYGSAHEYQIEYPFSYKFNDEILQSIKDYTQVLKYNEDGSYVLTDTYFTNAILTNGQQTSGVLNLFPKPKNSLKQQSAYPKYNADSKDITYTKSDSFYNFNTFWSVTKDVKQPIWKPSAQNLSIFRELNQTNCDYSKRSHKKAPLRAKDLKVRLITKETDLKYISQFITTSTQISYK